MKRSELLSIFLLSIFALSTMSIDDGNKNFQQSVKNISSDSTRAYPWINTPKRERDYFHLDELQNLCGSVKSIKEFVVDEKDSLKQIVRKAEYDLNGNLSMILYNIAHDITSRDVISSKDSSSFYWQYKFEYNRNRLKYETRINGESRIIVKSEIPKKQSLLKKNIYEILERNKDTVKLNITILDRGEIVRTTLHSVVFHKKNCFTIKNLEIPEVKPSTYIRQ